MKKDMFRTHWSHFLEVRTLPGGSLTPPERAALTEDGGCDFQRGCKVEGGPGATFAFRHILLANTMFQKNLN